MSTTDEPTRRSPRLTTEQVWKVVAKKSFAVLGHVTPSCEPRSTGIIYTTVGHRMYIATDPDSWKARHIVTNGNVTITVLVRRGGLLSLVAPIPPATISFRGTAVVHEANAPTVQTMRDQLAPLLPKDRDDFAIIEVVPEGNFVTYGVGVGLLAMRDTATAGGRVPVPAQ